MGNYYAKRLEVKGEGQLLAISSMHPLTKRDIIALIVHLNQVLSRLDTKPLVEMQKG